MNDKLHITLNILKIYKKHEHCENEGKKFKKNYDAIVSRQTRLNNIVSTKIFQTQLAYTIPYKSHI